MKKQVFNPYLPGNEYIPDGEPYVFGDRLYVYGSHDRFGAPIFCINDYVCWSAPIDDLGDLKYEGVIYRKKQDPKNRLGLRLLFAPDVVQGLDRRYYLYYALDFMGIIGVAVCENPCGEFQFLGHVHHEDGTLYGRRNGDGFAFDPGVLVDDDGRIYLYSGFGIPVPAIATGGKKLGFDGGYVLELESDMLTMKGSQKLLFPNRGKGAFAGHEFFEASSIRKYEEKYYFIYSSVNNHELCWAVSNYPTEGFVFGGTLISNGDLFLKGKSDENHATNYIGNNHGGMLRLDGEYYIFYHRHSNRSSYARQICVEQLHRDESSRFKQAEMTSCGLNRGPLRGKGRYDARIACNLWAKEGTGRYDCRNPKKHFAEHPYFTQDSKDGNVGARQYIANMRDGSVAGFKYFHMEGASEISVEICGNASGGMQVAFTKDFVDIKACIPVHVERKERKIFRGKLEEGRGVLPLYFRFQGEGSIDFFSFRLGGEE